MKQIHLTPLTIPGIDAEPRPGATIGDAAAQAVSIATMLGTTVRFVFNDVPLEAHFGTTAQEIEDAYWTAIGDRPKAEA
jgi:hypothetical protein